MKLLNTNFSTADKILPVLFVTLFLPFVFSPIVAQGATVSPGTPSNFKIKTPSSVKAGGEFTITLQVLDEEGNLVRNYDEMDREVLLNTTGEGDLSQSVVSSDQFQDGKATVELTYTRAQEIQILAREKNHVASGKSSPITVRAGQLDNFDITVPETTRAGNQFSVRLRAFDRFGNPVKNYSNQSNGISLETTGLEKPRPEFIPAKQFDDGQLRTLLSYTPAETMRLVIVDDVNGVRSTSDTIQVQPGRLQNFTLSVPDEAEAGSPFRVAIEARDKYGNIVSNYDELGQGVELSVPGGENPEPSYIAPDEFDNGVAFAEVRYNNASAIKLRVRDRRSSVEGESSEIRITAGGLGRYDLKVPEQVKAGKEFNVNITALDNFGNPIRQYSDENGSVRLSVRGSTDVTRTVDPTAFENGRAKVSFKLTRTGRSRLQAKNEQSAEISGLSQVVNVGPGPPGNITVDVPDDARAGNNFTALLTLKDKFGNVIPQPGFLDGEVSVSLINHSTGSEKVLDPGQFLNGRKRVLFQHERAEEVSIFVEYRKYEIRNTSDPIQIRPGEFEQVAVNSPGSVQAGSSFDMNVTLLDQFGNQLNEIPSQFTSIKLQSSGSGNVDPRIVPREEMSAPTFSIPVTYYVAETMSVKILDSRDRQLGISAPVKVTPGPLDTFSIQSPERVSADQEFTLRLEAKDPYQNTVTTLDERQGAVSLQTDSDTDLSRSQAPFGEFVNGVAEIPLEYHRAGDLRITASTQNVQTQSEVIRVAPGSPSSYEVLTQEDIRAGTPFPAVIKVSDRFGNSVTNLPDDFHGVAIKNESQLNLHPDKIDASLFSDGEANVFLAVTGTGELSLSAEPLEKPLERPEVDRFFLDREVDTATVSLLASHDLLGNVDVTENPESQKIEARVEPAKLLVEGRSLDFDNWFLNNITQSQAQFGKLPVVSVSLFSNQPVEFSKRERQNTLQLIINRGETTTSATLQEIQRLIQGENYDEAEQLLKQYLEDNPGDQDALQLRLRLQRLREVVGQ